MSKSSPKSSSSRWMRDLAVGHFVGRVARDDLRRRRLARAVGTHQRVDLARLDLQVDAAKDGLTALFGHFRV